MRHLKSNLPVPDLSICILTRPDWSTGLDQSLRSIEENTRDLSKIEVLVKIDHNASEQAYDVADRWANRLPVRYFIMDGCWRRDGVPEYSNVLGWQSRGRLMWWWSDEIRVGTPNWDVHMARYADRWENTLTVFFDKHRSGFHPGCSRKFHDTVGRMCHHLCIDSYLDITSGRVRHEQLIPIAGALRDKQIEYLERVLEVELIIDGSPKTYETMTSTDIEKTLLGPSVSRDGTQQYGNLLTIDQQWEHTDLNDLTTNHIFNVISDGLIKVLKSGG